jgi:hypothetical protein
LPRRWWRRSPPEHPPTAANRDQTFQSQDWPDTCRRAFETTLNPQAPQPISRRHIPTSRRIRPPGPTIQLSIRQAQRFLDQPGLSVGSSHPRDRIDLIKTEITSREPFRQHRKIGQPASNTNQTRSRLRTNPQPDTNPLRQRARPVTHPHLTSIHSLNQMAELSLASRRQPAEMIETPVDLIHRGTRPIHKTRSTNQL